MVFKKYRNKRKFKVEEKEWGENNMKIFSVEKIFINGPLILNTEVYEDYRGYLFESWNESELKKLGINEKFVQDKVSFSKKGVLRGLHLQYKHSQAKLVRVLYGAVFDVIVDLRKDSPTFGKWFGIALSEKNKKALYIPKNFAHGFLALTDEVVFFYKTSDYFYPQYDSGIIWNDKELNIDWPLKLIDGNLIISEKDKNLPTLSKFKQEVLCSEK